LKNTGDYDGFNEFNRQGILHELFENFGQDINSLRLITLLDLLCFQPVLLKAGFRCSHQETKLIHWLWQSIMSNCNHFIKDKQSGERHPA